MGHLALLWREKKTRMCLGSLFTSYEINYEFYKENTKFSELISFYCLQWLIWSEKTVFTRHFMKYKSGESIDSKIVRIGPRMCKLYLFEPTCVSLGFTYILPISNYAKCVIKPIQLNVLLNQATPQWSWNYIINPSQKEPKTYLSHVIIITSSISI